MPTREESPMPPVPSSTSNFSNDGTDRRPALACLNLPAAHQASNPAASSDFDSRSSPLSSSRLSATSSPNSEHPPVRNKKSLIVISRPNSPITPVAPDWQNGIPHESCHQASSSQTTSSNPPTRPDALIPPSSEIFAGGEEPAFGNCVDRNRLYFPPGLNPLNPHVAGISSSIEVLQINPPSDNVTHSDSSFIAFGGVSSKMTAHRRVPTPQDKKPASASHLTNSIRKPLLAPISVEAPQHEWEERRSEKRGLLSFPGQSYMASILHIQPLSSTSSVSSYNDRTPSPSFERRFQPSTLLRSIIFFIPRLSIRFLQYLVSPWSGGLFLPDFLSRNNAFGDSTGTVKFRRKGLASLAAIAYVIFCMLMFSHNLSLKLGLVSRSNLGYPNARGEMIPPTTDNLLWRSLFSAFGPFESQSEMTPMDFDKDWNPQLALKRRTNHLHSPKRLDNLSDSFAPSTETPLSLMSHTARFNKLHSKSGNRFSEEVTPLLFQRTHSFPTDSITACMFTNQFWLSRIPDFVRNWDGPVSLVVESFSADRPELMKSIQTLRKIDSLVRHRVDFHIVQTPDGSPTQKLKNAERMLAHPIATNAQLNVARFFSRSELVWLVGDARVLPSAGLYEILSRQTHLRTRVLDYGDAIVIPNFAFTRERRIYPSSFLSMGMDTNFTGLAEQYINASLSAIALAPYEWPKTRKDLHRLTTQSNSLNSDARGMVLYDQAWMPSEGPTNWTMWQASVQKLDSSNEELSGKQNQMYPIVSYDLNYAPNVIVSREGQPWCTERFEFNKAACVYQMYLSGTELWVLPEAWTLTVQQIPSNTKEFEEDPELKELISARLYSKFHQEACMHYGRELSSLNAWEDDRSKHARAICLHVLSSWGVRVSLEDLSV